MRNLRNYFSLYSLCSRAPPSASIWLLWVNILTFDHHYRAIPYIYLLSKGNKYIEIYFIKISLLHLIGSALQHNLYLIEVFLDLMCSSYHTLAPILYSNLSHSKTKTTTHEIWTYFGLIKYKGFEFSGFLPNFNSSIFQIKFFFVSVVNSTSLTILVYACRYTNKRPIQIINKI